MENFEIILYTTIAIMTTAIIGVVVGFAIVIKNLHVQVDASQDMIATAVAQDATNLQQMGLNLDAEVNKEVGNATVQTNYRINKIAADVAATSSNLQTSINSLTSGNTAFQSLAVGPAQLSRDVNGNLNFNTGPIFTVTSSNLKLALNGSQSYNITQDANNNMNLSGPGQLIAPPGGIGYLGGAYGVSKTASNQPLRMYAPASDTKSYIGLGFAQQTPNTYSDTLQIMSKAAAKANNDQVTINGDLVVSGNVNSPYIATLQEQITMQNQQIQTQIAQIKAKADLAYNAATMQEHK